MFGKIAEIKSIREEIARLSGLEKTLSAPLLTDMNLIDMLYCWYGEYMVERHCTFCWGKVVERKEFILAILLLYSPVTLAGGKMKTGLRSKLAAVLGIHSHSTISDNCSNIVFFFDQYKPLRVEVEDVYENFSRRLEDIGLLT